MWFMANKYRVFYSVVVLISSYGVVRCDAISNTSLNNGIREYSTDDGYNVSHVKTLQKEDIGKHAYYVLAGTPIKFKEISDSALSGSSNSRGLLFHDHPGYALNEYEETPHYDVGHDYHLHEPHPDPHAHTPHNYEHHGYDSHHYEPHNYDPHHYDPHHYGGHHHYDHGPYKHHKNALATKAVLWPLAGIALLGAAAALVSNPVLLQLGVISGKRRRRGTEEITGPDFPTEPLKAYANKIKKLSNDASIKNDNFKRRILKSDQVQIENPIHANYKRRILTVNNGNDVKRATGIKRFRASVKTVDQTINSPGRYDITDKDDDKFIPIPIKLRSPKLSDP